MCCTQFSWQLVIVAIPLVRCRPVLVIRHKCVALLQWLGVGHQWPVLVLLHSALIAEMCKACRFCTALLTMNLCALCCRPSLPRRKGTHRARPIRLVSTS
jgi:hypothetical protein